MLTDNNALVHLKSAKLGAVEQRWSAALDQFDCEIKYRPGKNNPADALSRLPKGPKTMQGGTDIPAHLACVHEAQCAEISVSCFAADACMTSENVTVDLVQKASLSTHLNSYSAEQLRKAQELQETKRMK